MPTSRIAAESRRRRKRRRVSVSGRSSPRATAWASLMPRAREQAVDDVAATIAARSETPAQIHVLGRGPRGGIACAGRHGAPTVVPRRRPARRARHAARAAAARAAPARRAARARRRRGRRGGGARARSRPRSATTARTWTRARTPAGLAALRAPLRRGDARRAGRCGAARRRRRCGAAGAHFEFRAFPDAAPALAALRERGHAARRGLQLGRLAARAPGRDGTGAAARRRGGLGRDRRGQAGARRSSATRSAWRAAPSRAPALHVGDTPEADVEGARAAASGRCSSPAPASAAPAGVPSIASLAELPDLLS